MGARDDTLSLFASDLLAKLASPQRRAEPQGQR
jgi:hypothetical protein